MEQLKEKIIFGLIRLLTFDYFVIKKNIRANLKKRGTVLDLGCGNGYLAKLFSHKKYLGVDINPELIKTAQKKYPRFKFKVGDITKLHLKEKYDFIVVVGVFHHLSDIQFGQALNVINNYLKKSGRVIVIEAIPPLIRWNFLGELVRKFDRGDYVREIKDYAKLFSKKFKISKFEKKIGGIIDYGLFILEQK